jgi:hypothetical protein
VKLERMWWDQVKNVDIEGLKKTVSPHYQQVLNIGAQDRTEWLEIAKNAKVKDYKIDNLKATQSENALIVSYTIVTKEFINGKELSNKPISFRCLAKNSGWLAGDFACQFKPSTLIIEFGYCLWR